MNLAFEEWLKGFNRVYEETTGRKLSLGEQMLMKAAWEGAAEKADLSSPQQKGGLMMHSNLSLAILRKYGSQAGFAPAVGLPESMVSRVLSGRRKLSKQEAAAWARALECDPSIFEGVLVDD